MIKDGRPERSNLLKIVLFNYGDLRGYFVGFLLMDILMWWIGDASLDHCKYTPSDWQKEKKRKEKKNYRQDV